MKYYNFYTGCALFTILRVALANYDCHNFNCNINNTGLRFTLNQPCTENIVPAFIEITVECGKSVEIQCFKNASSIYSQLEELKIGSITNFYFDCPLPEKSFREVMNRIGVQNVTILIIKNSDNEKTLTKQTLQGLHEVKKLYLDNNGLTSIPEELFKDMDNLEILSLRDNSIILHKEVFHHLPKLKMLELGNNNLTHLEPGIFYNLTQLKILNLWKNKLNNLTKTVFSDLRNLSQLDLRNNEITQIKSDLFSNLSKLKNISLQKNKFISLPHGLFLNNSQLEYINIYSNIQLKTLPNGLFANLTKLKTIGMEKCSVMALPSDLLWGSSVKVLNLQENLLRTLPEDIFRDATHLETLDLGTNLIANLPDTLFNNARNLKILKLNRNQLEVISMRLFSKLDNLEELYLENNKLRDIIDGSFGLNKLSIFDLSNNQLTLDKSYHYHPLAIGTLKDLRLANNSINKIFTFLKEFDLNLTKINLAHNKITKLEDEDLNFLQTHNVDLDVSFNNISTIKLNHIFDQNLPEITIYIEGNPIHCDCHLYLLIRYLEKKLLPNAKLKINLTNVKCSEPKYLRQKLLNKVSSEILTCPLNDSMCPNHCECLERIHDKALIVNCTATKHKSMPESLPVNNFTNHTVLYLSNNNITKLPLKLGEGYNRVTKYFLANNNITTINLGLLSSKLEELDISGNKLSHLDKKSIDFLDKAKNLQRISLHNNPWHCDCSVTSLVDFLQHNFEKVHMRKNISCTDDKPVIEVKENVVCSTSQGTFIVGSLIIAILGLMIGVMFALYYRYQREVKVWLYAHKFCLWFVSEEELDEDKLYDAFISYSHQDEDFVVNKLVPELEKGPIKFKLCLHYRDWIVGDFIPNQIARSVENSRRTVIVLSPSFLESVWGSMEFRIAHSQAINEGISRVIIILYKDIGPTDNLDSELKAYLLMNTYLKWGDPWFFDKLRYAMPHPIHISKSIPLVNQNKKPGLSLKLNGESDLISKSKNNVKTPVLATITAD
uniref:TIR domain-containing protein n=1 Tax=Clastoptera arizonana TaxID=38151 RepID=A0A1B6C0H1_9HEMI